MLDAKRIGHLDRPAADLVQRLATYLGADGRNLRIIGLAEGAAQRLLLVEAGLAEDAFFANLDDALEWAEGEILAAAGAIIGKDVTVPLAQMPSFEGLDTAQLDLLAPMMQEMIFPAGTVVFPQGGPPDFLYVLTKGQASIHVNLGNGQSHRVSTIGAGVHFGEMALLDGQPRSAEVRADSDLVCRAIDIARVRGLEAEHPHILAQLLTNLAISLSARLRKANLEIEQFTS